MGVGQLSADNEITALKANGISLWTVLAPLLLGGIGIFALQTAYNHFIFPKSNHALATLTYNIAKSRPMLEIQERRFTELNDKMTIYVQKKDDLTGRIEDVTIFEKKKPGDLTPRLTLATWGTIIPDHANDSMLLELHEGEIHDRPDKDNPDKYHINRFDRYNLTLNNVEADLTEKKKKHKSDREMDLKELLAAADLHRGRQNEVRAQVSGLGENLIKWQFGCFPASDATPCWATSPYPTTNRLVWPT
jgi:lipopolysaccharide export system permease protein